MPDIITISICLAPLMNRTTLKVMQQLIEAVLSSSGRVTMVGLSRWTGKGCSYRTIQRFFGKQRDWGALLWAVVEAHLVKENRVWLLAADEVVVSKAGTATYGKERFYSSLVGRPIGAVSFLAASVVDVEARKAYPVQIEQRVPQPKTAQEVMQPTKRGRGRPKGSKNHAKAKPMLNTELNLLDSLLGRLLKRIVALPIRHLVMDGFFGNYPTTWLVQQHGLHLISKLRSNAVLFFPYRGSKPRRGPTPRYGARLDYTALPDDNRVARVTEGHFTTEPYALTLLHKDFPDPLRVVVLVKTDVRSGKRSHVVLFSTDLSLTPAQLTDYYALRFQIEFNFRDAKQYFGLDDFMNVSPNAVSNAVGLAFFMCNLTAVLLAHQRTLQPDFSILDLKVLFRARRYLHETIIAFPEPPPPNIISAIWQRVSLLGAIRSLHTLNDAA
jgi:putative transposase